MAVYTAARQLLACCKPQQQHRAAQATQPNFWLCKREGNFKGGLRRFHSFMTHIFNWISICWQVPLFTSLILVDTCILTSCMFALCIPGTFCNVAPGLYSCYQAHFQPRRFLYYLSLTRDIAFDIALLDIKPSKCLKCSFLCSCVCFGATVLEAGFANICNLKHLLGFCFYSFIRQISCCC